MKQTLVIITVVALIFGALFSNAHALESGEAQRQRALFYSKCMEPKREEIRLGQVAGNYDAGGAAALRNKASDECSKLAKEFKPTEEEPETPTPDRSTYIAISEATLEETSYERCVGETSQHSLEVLKYPTTANSEKLIGVQDDGGAVNFFGLSYDVQDGDKIVIPGSENYSDWDVRVHVKGTAILNFTADTTFIVPCNTTQTHADRIILEEGYLSFIKKLVTNDIRYRVQTKEAIAGVKGTQFVVERRGGATTYFVTEGTVEVTPTNTVFAPFLVTAGEKATVSADASSGAIPLEPNEQLPHGLGGGSSQAEGKQSSSFVLVSALALLLVGVYFVLRKKSV